MKKRVFMDNYLNLYVDDTLHLFFNTQLMY